MTEGLFDNRYRYDHIYPRGRSGETLRAVDTQDGDRPVVIKRPAPQDAPPIRAGQEVSILTERRALQRLAGQPALTALLGGGQFNVGGIAHQYIVIERAEGQILADLVLELAGRGERLPELETLVIVDGVLELLEAAHALDIVYNDVDAKHVFWNRDAYRLKVIDWGNAVFLDGDDVSAQGVSRQSDIYQVGELLYFIVTGGGRVELPRGGMQNSAEDQRISFGADAERLHSRLQSIISRAAHPNPRFRYQSLNELRHDLTEYRLPVERDRGAVLARVQDRLRRELSRDELYNLLRTLEPVITSDPGFPAARAVEAEVNARMRDLQVSADLDAARIYLESGNWVRAAAVLEELQPMARGDMAILIALLLDWTTILIDGDASPAGPIQEAVGLLFEDDSAEAARVLVTQMDGDDRALAIQWLLAERISAHIPDILLLRPNLYRLQVALANLAADGIMVSEQRASLNEINSKLDRLTGSSTYSVIELRDGFRSVVDHLTGLAHMLDAVNASYHLPNKVLPVSALTRATNAAMALADNMHVIGKQATGSPRDALGALDHCRQIVPSAQAWEAVAQELDGLYQTLSSFEQFIPAPDGSDITGWLDMAHDALEPYSNNLFDERLTGIVTGLSEARAAWAGYEVAAVQGSKANAVTLLGELAARVTSISPALAGWIGQLRSVVSSATYVETHALFGALGRALADGWEAFDRGRLVDAERLGIQAMDAARGESERLAARRLRELAQIMREWLERGGINDLKRTQNALTGVELLYTPDEIVQRDQFAAQMPSKETYLKAMTRGLIEPLSILSTASVRIVFANALLYGALDARENQMDDAQFWRDAAARALGDAGPRHPLVRALDEFIQQRRDLDAAQALLTTVNSASSLTSLEQTRRSLEGNAQAKGLSPAVYSLRELEAAVRDWTDGEFRAAGIKLENAVKAIDETEQSAQITLTGYRSWLMSLLATCADLHTNARRIAQTVEKLPDQPPDNLATLHRTQEEQTSLALGEKYAGTLHQWRELYEMFAGVYADRSLRRSTKLNRMNDFFRAMFIERHPAYPLYRHWYSLTEQTPEFPPPQTSEPLPRINDLEEAAAIAPARTTEQDLPEIVYNRGQQARRGRGRLVFGALLLAAGITVAVVLTRPSEGSQPEIAVTRTVPGAATEEAAVRPSPLPLMGEVTDAVSEPTTARTLSSSPTPLSLLATLPQRGSDTATPTSTVTVPPTATATRTSTWTPTPSLTYTATASPTRTLPPAGLQGSQDVLDLAAAGSGSAAFAPSSEGEDYVLGTGSATGEGETIFVSVSPELLESAFGNDASQRITRVESTLILQSYNPPLLIDGDVYFGVLLQSADDPSQSVGLQVDLIDREVLRLSQYENGTLTPISQRAPDGRPLRVRLDYDPERGVVLVVVNEQQLGPSISLESGESGVMPVLFVHDGGVIVYVNTWNITLR